MRTKRCRDKIIHRPYRPIASKQDQPARLDVQNLSITTIGDSSYIIIHPSKARIKATDLIDMIKDDHVITNTGEKVPSQDLVFATTQLFTAMSPENPSTQDISSVPVDVWKRQANAFIRYRRANGKKLQALIPEYSEADISKFLGAVWKITPENIKQKYRQEWSASVAEQRERNPSFRYNPSNKASECCPRHLADMEYCLPVLAPSWEGKQGNESAIQENITATFSDLRNCPNMPDNVLDELFSSMFLPHQVTPFDKMSDPSGSVDVVPDDLDVYKFLDDWQSMINLCTMPHPQAQNPINLVQIPDSATFNPLANLNPAYIPVDPLTLWTEAPSINVTTIQQTDDVNQYNCAYLINE
ncbi:hypothetical protein BX666DRAFT_2117440 [Dichotomocladium elegans]|nr:hypothetical protein BX666DRAFT_2117440 [Dichotomocladium elegans]